MTTASQDEPPFPPAELMQVVAGLMSNAEFAAHGRHILDAVSAASPRPFHEYRSILDFGCGCGRLLRMLKGHPAKIHGCDIDRRHVEWLNGALDFVEARTSSVKPPLPYGDASFDLIVSVSVFSHLNEASQDAFLADLARISKPDAVLLLSIHGDRAMRRAETEPKIRTMINVPDAGFERARSEFRRGGYGFIIQQEHLTNNSKHKSSLIDEPYEYGITFIPNAYVRAHWARWFDILDIRIGAIHDWQDIVVAKPRRR